MSTHDDSYAVLSPMMVECIRECQTCHQVCLETISHCLAMGGEHSAPDHIRLLMDCAQICQTSADFMIRSSDQHRLTCGVCSEICRRCADECARFGDDRQMQRCAEVCRSCAASCEAMADGHHV